MSELTKLENLVDPEVLADMIQAKIESKIKIIPYAKVDTTLEGREGSEITVPKFVWEGEAEVVAEGEEIPFRNLGTKTEKYKVHKIGIGSSVTDEALLSGHGNVMGATAQGLAKSILTKLDYDAMAEYLKANTVYDAGAAISYNGVVNAIDKFEEEENAEKVMFVAPAQVTTLRLDPNFIDKTKYGNNVMVDGEIGMIGNARIVPSKKVAAIGGKFYCPIVKLQTDAETEDDIAAITYYIKRNTNVETARVARRRLTEISADQMYVVALTNDSRVVLASFTGADLKAETMYEEEYKYPNTEFVLNATGIIPTVTKTGTNAYTLNLAGVAPKIDAAAVAGLGYDSNTTNVAVYLQPIPDAPLKGFDPTKVKVNGNAVTANDIMFRNNVPYLVIARGLWDNDGITGATSSYTVGYDAGTANTFTYAYNGLTLA